MWQFTPHNNITFNCAHCTYLCIHIQPLWLLKYVLMSALVPYSEKALSATIVFRWCMLECGRCLGVYGTRGYIACNSIQSPSMLKLQLLHPCSIQKHESFTSLVLSTTGGLGYEAKTVYKILAYLLSTKSKRSTPAPWHRLDAVSHSHSSAPLSDVSGTNSQNVVSQSGIIITICWWS